MRILAVLCLLSSVLWSPLRAATGDISTRIIRADGWSAELYIEGFTSGATYDFDLAANNVPGADTPYLTVVSEGHDATPSLGTISRTVYLTHVLRVPYGTRTQAGGSWSGTFVDGETITCSTSGATAVIVGNQSSGAVIRYRSLTGTPLTTQTWTGGTSGATFVNSTNTVTTLAANTKDEFVGSAGMTVRVGLSEYLYLDDNTGAGKSGTAPTITIPAGFITNTGGAAQTSAALTAASVTQNAAPTYQPEIPNWSLPDRLTVANSITAEVVTYHQHGMNGRQAAAVVFRATDGSTTVTATATSTEVSGRSSDKHAVIVHRATLDITTLTAGLITVNAIAYPWVGDAAAAVDSANQSARREFSPRYYLKDPSRVTSLWRAYVDAAGNDGTGAWSTTDATAAAAPFLTPQGAINAIAAQVGAGNFASAGTADNCEVRIRAGTFTLASAASSRAQNVGALIITRDPAVARASAIVAFGTAAYRARLGPSTLTSPLTEGALVFRDITIDRTGTQTIQGEAANQLDVIFDDVDYDNNSHNATIFQNSHGRIYGMTLTASASSFASPGTYEWRCWRGVSGVIAGNVEGWLILGSTLETVTSLTPGGRTASGSIVAFNNFTKRTNINGLFVWGASANAANLAEVQNVVENTGTANGPASAISADNNSGDITNLVRIHNTYAGFDNYGRWNSLYNDTAADPRTHTHIRSSGNIAVQINTKHDVFMTDGSRIQSWAYLNGVGVQGEVAQYRDAGTGAFAQDFPGLYTKIGTSNATPLDVDFIDPQHTTSGPTGGAGDGDYNLGPDSVAINLQRNWLLSHDLAGVARSATDAAGAYHYASYLSAKSATGFWLP